MAIYVYEGDTCPNPGRLESWIPSDHTKEDAQAQGLLASDDVLNSKGFIAVDGLPPLTAMPPPGVPMPSELIVWDDVNRTTKSVSPPVMPKMIPTFEFIMLFTPAEHDAIFASNDARVKQLVMALTVTQQIDLNSAIIRNSVAYLVQQNLLTQDNADLILSGQQSQ